MYIFNTIFHFSYVKSVWDRGIILLKVRISIKCPGPVPVICWVRTSDALFFLKNIFNRNG